MAEYPNIKAELARAGLSVKTLADFLGTSSQNMYNKINGKVSLSEKDMRAVQSFFKTKTGGILSLEYLFLHKD